MLGIIKGERIEKVIGFLKGRNPAKIVQNWVSLIKEELAKRGTELESIRKETASLQNDIEALHPPIPAPQRLTAAAVPSSPVAAATVAARATATPTTGQKRPRLPLPSNSRVRAASAVVRTEAQDNDNADNTGTPVASETVAATTAPAPIAAPAAPPLPPFVMPKKKPAKILTPSKPMKMQLPEGVTFQTICSKCGRPRYEHLRTNFGNKCNLDSCGRCGAREEFHKWHQSPMGFECKLTVWQGGNQAMSQRFEDLLIALGKRKSKKTSAAAAVKCIDI